MAAYNHGAQYNHAGTTSATYMPGSLDNDYYMPPVQPVLVAPEPQRINPEMSNQIADGLRHLDLNSNRAPSYARLSAASIQAPHLSLFPKVTNKPNWLPPSDEEVEATLDGAREQVLNSTDPEMQLAWAQDALTYVGVCAEDEDRRLALKPGSARPQTPRVEHQLKIDAMSIVNFLADQHHPKAEFIKGMWLEWGRYGQREDKKEAFRCYSRAADRQYYRAHYRIGMLYESYNDPIKALKHYHLGVEAGDAASCYRLGMMTVRGQHGQQQDYPKAVDLLRKSADGADENAAQGAYVYGMLLARQLPQIELPEGILQYNESSARYYIQKAAYLKFGKAQAKMGSMFELGSLGCEFNPSYSVHYNALAAKQGEVDANMALSKWFLVGYEGLFPKNEEMAFTYAERAAQGGLPTAEFALGYFHEIGMHVDVDLHKAMEWYQKAWRHGNEDAKGRIDGLEKKQVLNKNDHEKMAVNRIKSQRGSMIGTKPDWLKQRIANQQQNRPPTVAEVLPPRDTTTPYPLNDGPPIAPPVRPATVTPYPMDDRPASRISNVQSPTGGFFNPNGAPPRPNTTIDEARPSTAFQLAPAMHMNNSLNQHQTSNQGYNLPPRSPPRSYGQPERPATIQPINYGGRPSSRPPDGRIPSGPPSLGGPHVQNPGPGYQMQRPPVDLGYSAPIDDRRRPQQPQTQPQQPPYRNSATAHTQPLPSIPPQHQSQYPPHSSHNTQNPHPAQNQNLAHHSQTLHNAHSAATPSSRPNPGRPTNGGVSDGRKPVPPSKTGLSGPVSQTNSTGPTSSSASTASGKPSGPKTFEEMGVPAGKQESECVIM